MAASPLVRFESVPAGAIIPAPPSGPIADRRAALAARLRRAAWICYHRPGRPVGMPRGVTRDFMDAGSWIRVRLAVMMALIYSVQGAFWPVLAIHLTDLGIADRGRGWIFATMAIASFTMPLGAGQLVDRLMPTQRFLSWSFAAGAVLLGLIAAGVARSTAGLFGLFLAYWLCMAPSYSLSNSLAFRNLARPERDYARVRLWGTVGWMVVGWVVSLAMATSARSGAGPKRGAAEAFWIAAGFSALTAVYCRTLPNTPPVELTPGGRRTSVPRDVLDLLRSPAVAIYFVAAFGVSLTPPFLYQVLPQHLRALGLGRAWVSSAMSLGQWPEVVGLAVLPTLIRRWGYRATLVLGVAAYALRFALLAAVPSLTVAILGIPLHGVGVACFSIVGQMFINSRAAADRRASSQAVNTVINGGIGSMTGSLLASEVVRLAPADRGLIFLVPCLINVGLVILLLARFRPGAAGSAGPGEPAANAAVDNDLKDRSAALPP